MKKLFKGKNNTPSKDEDQSEEGLFEQARVKFKSLKKNVSYFLDSLKKYDKAVRALNKPAEELATTTKEFCEGDVWPIGEQIAKAGLTFTKALQDYEREMDVLIDEIRNYEQKLSEMQKKINERDKLYSEYKDKQKALIAAKKDPSKEMAVHMMRTIKQKKLKNGEELREIAQEKFNLAKEAYENEHKSTMTELTLLLNNRIIDFEKYFRAFGETQMKLWCTAMTAYRISGPPSLPSSTTTTSTSTSSSSSSSSYSSSTNFTPPPPLPARSDSTLTTSTSTNSGPPPLPTRERSYTMPVNPSTFTPSQNLSNQVQNKSHTRQTSDPDTVQIQSTSHHSSNVVSDSNGPPPLPPRASQKFAYVPVSIPTESNSNPPPLPSRENRPKVLPSSQITTSTTSTIQTNNTSTPSSTVPKTVPKSSVKKGPTYPLPPQLVNNSSRASTTVRSPTQISTPPQISSSVSTSNQQLEIPPEERQKYTAIFRREDPQNTGFITGAQAYTLFSRSGLTKEELAQIWDLSDQDVDGKLDLEEFILAMFLINSKLMGRITTIPQTLPPNLIIKK